MISRCRALEKVGVKGVEGPRGPSEHSLGALDEVCAVTKTFSSFPLLHDGGEDMI